MSEVKQYNDVACDALRGVEKPCSVLLRISWDDSTQSELSICESVGWLACISDDVVTIAANKTVCDDAKDVQIGAMIHIPVASIQKLAILQESISRQARGE